MKLCEMSFRDYYHQYILLEADVLTEALNDTITVDEQDCFLLCSSFIADNGRLRFNVLSCGTAWDQCRKGLTRKKMLHIFEPDELKDLEARAIEPDEAMINKNEPFILKAEGNASRELLETRADELLDDVRNDFYPDVVKAGVLTQRGIREYDMKLQRFNGPFAEGILLADTGIQGYRKDTLLRALPYQAGSKDHHRLLVVFAGPLSREDRENMDLIIREGTALGFGFSRHVLRS